MDIEPDSILIYSDINSNSLESHKENVAISAKEASKKCSICYNSHSGVAVVSKWLRLAFF